MSARRGIVFVFSGHGCQWTEMARELLDASPLFASHIQACEQALAPHIRWSLSDVLRGKPRARRLQRVDVVQPALFAVTVSLAELWRACGVLPDAVVGHSQGEVAAAHFAGGLSLQDAAMIVARRSRVLAGLSGRGGMAVVASTRDWVEDQIESLGQRLDLGAVNGPRSLAVGGASQSLEELLARCKGEGATAGKVAIDYASHSRQIEPLREQLLQDLAGVRPSSGELPFFSTVTGGRLDCSVCDVEHWYRGERGIVQFEQAMRALLQDGYSTFVEISPHAVLAAAMQETVDLTCPERADVLVASTLRRGQGDPRRFLGSLAEVEAHGVAVDWAAVSEVLGSSKHGDLNTAEIAQRGGPPRLGQAAVPLATRLEDKSPLGARIERMAKPERERIVLEAVAAELASVLGLAALDGELLRRPFRELGLDSSGVVELRNRLRALTRARISATLVFDRPTAVELARGVLEELTGGEAPQTSPVPSPSFPRAVDSEDPIAIVGMSCRFPGDVSSPQELWELLHGGGDAIGAFPTNRGWDLDGLYDPDPEKSGTSYAREGGFLHDAADFDAAFFNVSPREALTMDPQQRLFLEVCWEALESAGLTRESASGSQTGVFAGINTLDYNARAWLAPDGLEGYDMTGAVGSVIAGRVSYVFGLNGPAMTVDTACSSSLVSLHLACGALRRGECSLALAGGVSVMVGPGLFAAFSRQRALALDGRCKPFARAADGTGWSEGAGSLALERLEDAQRNGHRVHALVRGSAINQDGASNGLTAPSGRAQQQVIRQALASAGLSPAQVDAVEAHGTGTRLGDPIEAEALLATYGRERPAERPLWLGSIKSNIGHAQAAAGVAGVIKMVMALRRELLPKTLHVDEPSAEIDWSKGAVSLLLEPRPWPAGSQPRRAGVSSYGISGTNAHVILEEAPSTGHDSGSRTGSPTVGAIAAEVRPIAWVLSGRSEEALSAQAARLERFRADNEDLSSGDLAVSLAARSAYEHRAVVLGNDLDELSEGVRTLARGRSCPTVLKGTVRAGGERLALLFTGQGAQRLGMGGELHRSLPIFASAFDEVCAHMDEHLPLPLGEIVLGGGVGGAEARAASAAHSLNDTLFTQTGLFALEVGLYRLLASWGVRPAFVLGHSIGELVAAFVAGVFSLPDACRLVAARGSLMGALPAGGAMVAVQALEQELAPTLVGLEDQVAIAAINSPSSLVLSGDEEVVLRLAREWEERGRKTRRLNVSHAFHSPRMDDMLERFARVAESVSFNEPSIPLVSNLTGALAGPELCSPEYWVRHVRRPVRFAEGISALREQGVTSFLELGPEGVLSGMTAECFAAEPPDSDRKEPSVVAVPVLRRAGEERQALHSALARIWTGGVKVDWAAPLQGSGALAVELPTYAFQRKRYWLETSDSARVDALALGQLPLEHPLLGSAVTFAAGEGSLLTGRLSLQAQPWIADHVVLGSTLLSGTALLELALHAGAHVGCESVRELTLQSPLALPEQGGVQLQVSVGEPDESGCRSVSVHSRLEDPLDEDEPPVSWTAHAVGILSPAEEAEIRDSPAAGEPTLSAEAWPPAGSVEVDVDQLYMRLADGGLECGPSFRCLRRAWRRSQDMYAEAVLPESEHDGAKGFALHPGLLDGALHALGAGMLGTSAAPECDRVWLPFSWGSVTRTAATATTVRVRFSASGPDTVSLAVADRDGRLLMSVGSLTLRATSSEQLRTLRGGRAESLYTVDWVEHEPQPAAPQTGSPTVLGSSDGVLAGAFADARVLESLDALVESIEGPSASELTGPVLVDCTAPGTSPAAVRHGAHRALALLQAWLAEERLSEARLAIVTRSTLATVDGERVSDVGGGAIWGLVRSAQSEHPGRFALIDVDGEDSSWKALSTALASGEPQLAIRDGALLVPRLARVSAARRAETQGEHDGRRPAGLRDGTVLITGGTGALGARLARHLVQRHEAQRLLLVSRRGPHAQGATQLLEELSALGAHVEIAACDVSDRAQLAQLLQRVPAERPLLLAVHAAGVLDDGVIGSLTPERLDGVIGTKLDAAWHLHELTQDAGRCELVLFSSVAGVLGSAGQGNYAAANASLDALAAQRRAQGLTGTSIAWGLWADTDGMGGGLSDTDMARAARTGMLALDTDEGLALFDRARSYPGALSVPVRLDIRALGAQARAGALPVLLAGLARGSARRAEPELASSPVHRLLDLSEDERERIVQQIVRAETASVLGHTSEDAIPMESAFKELGFDSLVGVELRNQLGALTGLRLPVTLVFDHPSPAAVARYLIAQLAGGRPQGKRLVAPAATVAGRGHDDPIAIVGMSCRYPGGVSTPEDLWRLVAGGRDAVGPFPEDRGWDVERLYDPDPDRVGTSYTREGGFVYDAGEFDPAFFGIAPREALAMDPQQRLLLEVCWEALERASIDPTSLRGSATGVFAGVMYHDYASRLGRSAPGDLEAYLGIGSAGSVVSGRTAYVLGLEGPAVTVDTACSSSLVAMHWAAQALRSEECTLALAGGVTVLSTPGVFLEFSRQRGLSPDGRCKSFSGDADGTGWGEGAGVVLLERLSDARRNGRKVLALVRGSAVNQDGASNGLTAPNGPSQQRVIRQALANAEVSPAQVDAVEGHGTGTTLGDPIEVQALLATYGQDRPDERPLWLGSVKSNLGHTQAAAGVAGVIKTLMAMRHGVLPRTLHAERPSEKVDWSDGAVALLRSEQPWTRNGEPRRAGVSSFGISGTNAHVILEEAPALEPARQPGAGEPREAGGLPGRGSQALSVVPWVISAKSERALRAQAQRLRAHVEADGSLGIADVGSSLVSTRTTTFPHRAVVLGGEREGLLEALASLGEGSPSPSLVDGLVGEQAGGIALMFSGQGAQRVGMGRGLYGAFPVFRGALEEVCGHLDGALEWPLLEVMLGEGKSHEASLESGRVAAKQGLLDDTSYTQSALFALEVALFRLVESFGLRPSFLLGHSIGELTAAHVAGALSLEHACALVAARGRLMAALPPGGAMVAAQVSELEGLEALAGLEDRVALAAVNGPSSIVLSGEERPLLELTAAWEERGVKTKRLRVSHAFHSPLMEAMLEELREVAQGLTFEEPRIPLVSNVTGRVMKAGEISAAYWVRHARETVRFAGGLQWLKAQGVANLLELGPDGVLCSMAGEGLEERNGDRPLAVSLLRAERPEAQTLLHGLARLWVRGASVDWGAAFASTPAESVELPTYAFQRERYWLEAEPGKVVSPEQAQAEHPLLGAPVLLAQEGGWVFTGRLSLSTHPWLGDHLVFGRPLLPGTALLELALQAGAQLGCETVEELTLQEPLALPAQGAVQLQVSVGPDERTGTRSLSIYSRLERDPGELASEEAWICHAVGSLVPSKLQRGECSEDLLALNWPPPHAEEVSLEDLADDLAARGLDYGPAFQGLVRAWRSERDIFAEVELPQAERGSAERFGLHPALLDSALHALALLDFQQEAGPSGLLRLPFSWGEATLLASGASNLRVRLRLREGEVVSISASDQNGEPVASIGSLATRSASAADVAGAREPDGLFQLDWVASAPALGSARDSAPDGRWVLVGAPHPPLQASLAQSAIQLVAHPDLSSLREEIESGARVPDVLLLGAGVQSAALPGGAHESVLGALGAIQELLAEERLRDARMVLMTERAVSVDRGEELPGLAGAAVWGLARSAQSENPGRLVLLDVDGEARSWESLAVALATDEPQIAIRRGELLLPRLVRVRPGDPASPSAAERRAEAGGSFDARGTVLITGGTGGLGAEVARHLVLHHGVAHLLLVSRSGDAAPQARELKEELEGLDASVRIAACDVSQRDQLEALISSTGEDPPLRGVVHAAGVIDDGVIDSLTPERVERVLGPKLDAAWHLHELTAHLELDAFVLFSSVASTLGGPGQGNYAAANSFLDALAAHRRALGLPALAMAWGPWEQATGMTAQLGQADLSRIASSGILSHSREQGLGLFDLALAGAQPAPVLARLDMGALRGRARREELPRVLSGLVRMPAPRAGRASGGSSSLATLFASAPESERDRVVLEFVRAETASVLGYASTEAMGSSSTFKDLGFDSLAAVELRNRLGVSGGVQLTATLVFDYPTLGALATHLCEELSSAAVPEQGAAPDFEGIARTLSSMSAEEAHRVGMAARLQDILSDWTVVEETVEPDSAETDLSLVADEEIFELIDREFGVS